jgi:hypothetical protein
VSQFAVRKSDAESISSENSRTELSSTPIERNPWRSASSDAAGNAPRNASTPCRKSRLSYSFAAVASDGAPSSNSSVPRRLSTRSGVEIDARLSLLTVSPRTAAWRGAGTMPVTSVRVSVMSCLPLRLVRGGVEPPTGCTGGAFDDRPRLASTVARRPERRLPLTG